jgi:hypothetical protein
VTESQTSLTGSDIVVRDVTFSPWVEAGGLMFYGPEVPPKLLALANRVIELSAPSRTHERPNCRSMMC